MGDLKNVINIQFIHVAGKIVWMKSAKSQKQTSSDLTRSCFVRLAIDSDVMCLRMLQSFVMCLRMRAVVGFHNPYTGISDGDAKVGRSLPRHKSVVRRRYSFCKISFASFKAYGRSTLTRSFIFLTADWPKPTAQSVTPVFPTSSLTRCRKSK